jgi:hypothetical protein
MRRLPLPFALAALFAAIPARADWQYTMWGMTPEQVVAASKGSAHLLAPDKQKTVPPLVSSVEGTFQEGPLALRTVFSFDIKRGGLACVFYGVEDAEQSIAFMDALLKRYGKPTSKTSLPAIGMETVSWQTGTDEIQVTATKGDQAFAIHCAKRR